MPLIHIEPFKVRSYECDAYGHVNNTTYLRYMQEAAFNASAAAGYDRARYDAIGHHWLVRETDIEYLRPLFYGDTFEVKTWVEDFRRVRSRRSYEFRRTGSADLIARAHTDWVYYNNKTQQPATVPPEMIAAFFPEGMTKPPAKRDPFPSAPPPPPGVFRMNRRVLWRDIDSAGHVNNSVYLSYIEDCGMLLLAESGWSIERMIAEGFVILIRRHQIEYLQPAAIHDNLEIAMWTFNLRGATAMRYHTITRMSDRELLVRAYSYSVWVNPVTGRPVRVPERFLADTRSNIVA